MKTFLFRWCNNVQVHRYLFSSGGAGITCECHFSQQVLDLWCDAKFVQIQAEIKHRGRNIYTKRWH